MTAKLFEYELHQKIKIIPLGCDGKIIGLYYGEDGCQYRIRYFYEGCAKTEYMYPDEISA